MLKVDWWKHVRVNTCLFICDRSVIIKVLHTHCLISKHNFYFSKLNLGQLVILSFFLVILLCFLRPLIFFLDVLLCGFKGVLCTPLNQKAITEANESCQSAVSLKIRPLLCKPLGYGVSHYKSTCRSAVYNKQ